jgi:hypothetical protein
VDIIGDRKVRDLQEVLDNKHRVTITGIWRPTTKIVKVPDESGTDLRPLGLDRTFADPNITYSSLHRKNTGEALYAMLNNKGYLSNKYQLSE